MLQGIAIYLKNLDWVLFLSVLLLVCFGLVELYSIALGQGGADLLNFQKQLLFIFLGLLLLFFFAFIDYHNLRSYGNYIYLFGIVALLSVLFFGQTIRGTRGWFSLGGFNIQPVEFIKIILVLFLARYFSSASLKINPLKHLFITGAGCLLFVGLVILQPDFGSSMILLAIWLAMLFIAGFNKKYLLVIFLILSLIFSFAWGFVFKDYQKQRIITFLNPGFNPLSQGYNIAQAIIAVGAGGLAGRGLGFGSQSQLKFLPEAQTDFIFAVIAEELGFLGVCLIMLFFGIFIYRSLLIVKRTNNDFGAYFILGSLSLIFVELFINIGMNLGMLPVIGIALPFVSYGGSSLLANFILVGIIQSIAIRSKLNY